jgi:hypothetical protein
MPVDNAPADAFGGRSGARRPHSVADDLTESDG